LLPIAKGLGTRGSGNIDGEIPKSEKLNAFDGIIRLNTLLKNNGSLKP
jgi:hypothetical protein